MPDRPGRPVLPVMHRAPASRPREEAGFTLIELVMVIVITAAVATVALPKVMDTGAWRLRAFSDELLSQGLTARRLALGQRRPVVLTLSPTGASVAYASGTVIATLNCPSAVPSCISESGSRSVTFNSGNSGSSITSTGGTLTVTVTDGASFSRVLGIEPETGLIRPLS